MKKEHLNVITLTTQECVLKKSVLKQGVVTNRAVALLGWLRSPKFQVHESNFFYMTISK